MLALVPAIILAGLLFASALCIHFYKRRRIGAVGAPASVLVVLGSGGHTAEMLRLLPALPAQYSRRFFVAADTDVTSEAGARARKVCER